MKQPKLQFDHPTQTNASTFLQAIIANDAPTIWSHPVVSRPAGQ